MQFCEQCGKKLASGASFCEECGAPVAKAENEKMESSKIDEQIDSKEVVEEVVEKVAKKEPEMQQNFQTDRTIEEPATKEIQNNQQSQGNKNNQYVGLAIILILVAGGIFWFVNSSNNNSTENNVTASSEVDTTLETSSQEKQQETSSKTSSEEMAESSEELTKEQVIFDAKKVEEFVNQSTGRLANPTGVYISPIVDRAIPYEEDADLSLRSASIVKLFIMETFYHQVNEGYIRLNEIYTLQAHDKVGGSGILQSYDVGTQLSYEELVRHMIVDSDNTAGNILINLLGGPQALTKLANDRGYKETKIERHFVDTKALENGYDNYTSARDVGELLMNIYRHQAVSVPYDQQMLTILSENKNRSKLPAQIGSEVTVYNKTGEYGDYGVQNDACIFEKDDQAYVIVVLSQDGNESAQIQAMNQLGLDVYNEFLKGE